MNDEEEAAFAKAIGASTVAPVRPAVTGPLDVLALREEVGRRLRSTGGRPTDPAWGLSRQVPFKEVTWERLRSIADEVGRSGPRVGPAQVAALLVESSLEDETEWHRVLHASSDLPLLDERDAASRSGVTYRQFDDWLRRGWIVPASRSGRIASFSVDETMRVRWLRTVPKSARAEATGPIHQQDLTQRFLVTVNGTSLTTARSRRELLDLIEQGGDYTVIDQLAERRVHVGADPNEEAGHEVPVRRAV